MASSWAFRNALWELPIPVLVMWGGEIDTYREGASTRAYRRFPTFSR